MSAWLLAVDGRDPSVSLVAAVSETSVPGSLRSGAQPFAHRVRVTLQFPGSGRRVHDRHLRVVSPAPRPWPLLADVLVAPGEDAAAADALAAAHPGAAVAAVFRGAEKAWLRIGPYGSGPLLPLGDRHSAGVGWGTWGSLAHAWLVAGLPPAALGSVAVRTANRRATGPGSGRSAGGDSLLTQQP